MITLYPHRYPKQKGFKLLSLQPEFLELLSMAIEQFEASHAKFFDMQLTPTQARREALAAAGEMAGADAIHALQGLTANMREEQEALRYQEWRRKQAKALTPELHARLSVNAAPFAKDRVQDMNRRWQYQGHDSYFGDETLMRAFRQLSA